MNNKLPNLDALRLFLAMSVVIYHINDLLPKFGLASSYNLDFLFKGPLAVNYFFSLSGFLIIRLLWKEKTTFGQINIGNFYMRRILRILPLYFIVLLVGILAYEWIMPSLIPEISIERSYSFGDLIFHYLFMLPNVFKAEFPEVGPILDVLWSIGIEEQFYLFIPLILFLGTSRWIRPTLLLSLVVVISCFWYFSKMDFYYMYYFYFLFSGLLAILLESGKLKQVFGNKAFQLLVLLLFLLNFTTSLFEIDDYFLRHMVRMVLSGFLVATLSTNPLFKINNKYVNHLGKVSYGIYMYHMIIISAVVVVLSKLNVELNLFGLLAFYAVCCTLVFGVATLSYHFVEKRFLGLKKAFRHEPGSPLD
ncbi:acyltransferase family protein [Roseivirga misakiensis]|uniref:Acyltransferase 3 domain-containing protein n=1 Tax=Roseivirga misakiensis TaxID=1563681 RepID=A0A1E5T5W1_9BACT|nr:acyltransferase [Roseivirga misakiensis]OEK06755.1 hypothetical protein BFP71_03585 [Roseivirga misakiensis]